MVEVPWYLLQFLAKIWKLSEAFTHVKAHLKVTYDHFINKKGLTTPNSILLRPFRRYFSWASLKKRVSSQKSEETQELIGVFWQKNYQKQRSIFLVNILSQGTWPLETFHHCCPSQSHVNVERPQVIQNFLQRHAAKHSVPILHNLVQ